ncbi:ribose 5-phosphate isomerase B [Candidatus Pacearchaeota archaeon CG10_big_fil_rev_8_21_14_0_10_31_24]|nr:MAG: ribose 5-phosphate isomerase B [Candidatus Pacearchaeota archaeon CG10_big_fil_rev_8_21_14_0_10_31_24]
MKIYLGADHAGFALKEKIKEWLSKKDIYFEDFGSYDSKMSDDYPDYAFKVGEKVARHKEAKGILICGSGTGMVIATNKVKGIRASMAYDSYSAKMARIDNDANVLCLRAREMPMKEDLNIVKTWLRTNFSGKDRHKRRIKKIEKYEQR